MDLEYLTTLAPDVERELLPVWTASYEASPELWARYVELLGRDAFRVVRRGGEVVGGLALFETAQWFGGRPVPSVGVAAVGIAPHARGEGVASTLMARTLLEARDRGHWLASLYASTTSLYRRAGFELAGAFVHYAQPLRLLDRSAHVASGDRAGGRALPVRRLPPGRHDALHALHRARAAEESGVLDRNEALWRRVVREDRGNVAAYLLGPDEAPEGYVVLRQQESAGPHHDLVATDLVVRTGRAARRLWTLLADHATTAADVHWYGPAADPLVLHLAEQEWRVVKADAWMLRVLDAPKALSGRGWPAHLEGELHLELRDALVPANQGRWRLRVAGGAATVEPGGRGELQLDVATLAPLYTGHVRASRLAADGRLEGPPAAVELAGRLFAGPAPWMPDRF